MYNVSEPERLQKYIAKKGLASRRQVEQLITEGKVLVNGRAAVLGQKVTSRDQIVVNGRLIPSLVPEKLIYMLNKPLGIVSTSKAQDGERTVVNLIKSKQRLFPVGRLDKNTSGLILLTNDGEIAYQLTHPKFQIEKEYIVKVNRPLSGDHIKRLITGIKGKFNEYRADNVEEISHLVYKIVLHEGKNREVRRMMQLINREIISLKRVRIAKLNLGDLALGEYRLLNKEEINLLTS
jgi:23S rRNA pseudouridine2605 synthase